MLDSLLDPLVDERGNGKPRKPGNNAGGGGSPLMVGKGVVPIEEVEGRVSTLESLAAAAATDSDTVFGSGCASPTLSE